MNKNVAPESIADESEIEGAVQFVSRVRIHTDSDSGTDSTPTTRRKRRRHRLPKTNNDGDMEVDAKKETPAEPSNNGQMDWEGTAETDAESDNSYGYIDADDEQSDYPDYAFTRPPRPEAGSQSSRRNNARYGLSGTMRRRLERFFVSSQRELTLNEIHSVYPIERFIRCKKIVLLKRGRGVVVLRKHD